MHMKKNYMKRIEGTGRKGGRRRRTERGGGAASRQGRQWGRAPATTSTMVGAGRGAGARREGVGDQHHFLSRVWVFLTVLVEREGRGGEGIYIDRPSCRSCLEGVISTTTRQRREMKIIKEKDEKRKKEEGRRRRKKRRKKKRRRRKE